jgi:hypothetical protein
MTKKKKEKDNRKEIEIDLTEHDFYLIAKMAHEKDITFNEMCDEILIEEMDKERKI